MDIGMRVYTYPFSIDLPHIIAYDREQKKIRGKVINRFNPKSFILNRIHEMQGTNNTDAYIIELQ